MPRPVNKRRISHALQPRLFKPQAVPKAKLRITTLTLDGLEALRLADVERLYHEEGARRMGVSRATFARVLAGARGKVAVALVEGRAVEIRGGTVESTAADRWPCPVHQGKRRGRDCRCPGVRGPVGREIP